MIQKFSARSPPSFLRRFVMTVPKPLLPYPNDHLEPHISKETLDFHYGKHHMAYYNKLTTMIKDTEHQDKDLIDIIKATDGPLFNQAAQTWNHSFYWDCMKANKEKAANPPTGRVKELIDSSFGSFDKFKEEFTGAATGHFGSGWAWLVYCPNEKKLKVMQTHDADCPIKGNKGVPILTCDVWEHAFYVDYRNDKASYVAAFWSVVNWDFANNNLANVKA